MCKNFLSLDISLEIGFFIRRNSKLKVKTIYEIWGDTSITLNATINTVIAESVTISEADYYLVEVSVKLLPVSENADGSTTYILYALPFP